MKYIRNTTDFYIEENTVLSLGKFDGIHRGHEQLLQYFAKKKDEGLAGAIFTFDIPPRRNVQNVEAKVLTTNEEKRHMFEQLGIDYVVECPFTQEIMCMEPEDFIAKIVRQLHVKCMVVGEDFHFGHNRRGDYHMLRQYAGKYGYEVIVVDKRRQPGHQQHVREGRDRSREYREGKSSSGIPLLCDQQSPARQPDRKNDRGSDHQPAAAEGEAAAAERCLRDGGIHRRPVVPRHQQRGVQAYD